MAGLTHLSETLVKKGKKFVQDLLDKEVTISEKLDGANFNVKKISDGFEYYKRDGKNPISKIDLTLSVFFQAPIDHFENLPQQTKDSIAEGTYFVMEYFPRNKTVEIEYDNLPDSKLALEQIKLSNGKYVQDKKDLDKWAELIEIHPPAIIFQGKLDSTQRNAILQFTSTPFEDLVEQYKTLSFSRFIIELLNPKLETSFLKNSLDAMIEGIVFNFKGDDESIFGKLVDPTFTAMAKEKAKTRGSQHPSDIYGILVSDITEFINTQKLSKYKITGNDFSERYIDLISQLYMVYVNGKYKEIMEIKFELPDFLAREEHSININKIPYTEIKKLVKKDKNFEELYKMFLATFRKEKKRAYGYFTREFINNIFNKTVEKLHTFINRDLNSISMDDINGFIINEEDYLEGYNIIKETDNCVTVEIPTELQYNVNELTNTLNTTPQEKNVNVVVGRFQPIHNGHIAIADFLHSTNGLPSVYIIIKSTLPNPKSPISNELLDSMFDDVVKNNKNIIGFSRTNQALLNEVISMVRDMGFEPVTIGAGNDRVDSYQEQLDWIFNKGDNRVNITEDFQIIQTPRVLRATDVRNAVINNNSKKFTQQVPKYLTSYFDKLREALCVTFHVFDVDLFIKTKLKYNKKEMSGVWGITEENDKIIIKVVPMLADKTRTLLDKMGITNFKEIVN